MKSTITSVLLLFSLQIFGQINFINDPTWDQASKLAKSKKKLIFLHLQSDHCQECNEVAQKAFASPALQAKLSKNFVSFLVNVDSENGKKLAAKFEVKYPPVSLFTDAKGNVLSSYNGSTSVWQIYEEQADLALSRKDGKQLDAYEKEYNEGERSLKFLEAYMLKRNQAAMPVDQLLDEYVGKLPVDSLSSFRVLRFIFPLGPTIDSRAFKLSNAVNGDNITDSVCRSFTAQQGIALRTAITINSFQKAVKDKNDQLALQTAYRVQSSYQLGGDYLNGQLGYSRNMLRYYYLIKDTLRYANEARDFLEFTHMRMTPDSLRKLDQSELRNRRSADSLQGKGLSSSTGLVPPSQFFHMDLNEHAWHFFEMSGKTGDLERALKWSYQSQEFFNQLTKGTGNPMRLGNPAYIDTYAQILYKLGRKEEAITWQTKAVEAQKVTGNSSASLEETLAKMKAGL